MGHVWRTILTLSCCCDNTGKKWTAVTEVTMSLKVRKESWRHSDTAETLDLTLHYLEQQPSATPADLFMRQWHNYASYNRLSSLCKRRKKKFLSSKKQNVQCILVSLTDFLSLLCNV